MEDWGIGSTVTTISGVDYQSLQFRQDCQFFPDQNHPAFVSPVPGTCAADGAGFGTIGLAANAENFAVASTCVLNTGNPEAVMPVNYWAGGVGTDVTGCTATSIAPGGGDGIKAKAGQAYTWTVTYTGSPDYLIVSPTPQGVGTLVLTGAPSGSTWGAGAVLEAATGSPEDITFVAPATLYIIPTFYCVEGGALYSLGPPG